MQIYLFKMFNGLRSKSPSPCPSPVREFVANLKGSSPKPRREKYQTMIEPQEPIISKGRMTMTGGFEDFRPHEIPLEIKDLYGSDCGSASSASTSRSNSCDSDDPIMDPTPSKMQRRFVKVPRNALKNVIHQLSPRLSKRLLTLEEKKYDAFTPQNPTWPHVLSTYARGVSTTHVQSLITPAQPSLTAMKARAILDDKRNVRAALQILAMDMNQRQMPSISDDSSCPSSSYNSDQEESEETPTRCSLPPKPVAKKDYEPSDDIAKNLMEFDLNKADGISNAEEIFPMNPKIRVSGSSSFDVASEDVFQDESILSALDIDSLPTLSPEELLSQRITEVRNIHMCREYIILETGPPTDSIFV